MRSPVVEDTRDDNAAFSSKLETTLLCFSTLPFTHQYYIISPTKMIEANHPLLKTQVQGSIKEKCRETTKPSSKSRADEFWEFKKSNSKSCTRKSGPVWLSRFWKAKKNGHTHTLASYKDAFENGRVVSEKALYVAKKKELQRLREMIRVARANGSEISIEHVAPSDEVTFMKSRACTMNV